MSDDITQHDQRRRRCPMLGHEVPFSYCRAPGRDLPCGKVLDCWFEAFDVRAFIDGHYTAAEIEQILAPRPDKTVTLLELIERARRTEGNPDG